MENTKTTKNYKKEILKATKQSSKIVLDPDFNKSMKIISSYPILTQYIKLGDLFLVWCNVTIRKTNDPEVIEIKNSLIKDIIHNMELYSKNGDVEGLKTVVMDMKKTLGNICSE